MAIVVRLDVMLAMRKVRSKTLAAHVGITESNLSLLKSGNVRGVRFVEEFPMTITGKIQKYVLRGGRAG